MESNPVGVIKTAKEALLCKSSNHVKTSLLSCIYSIRTKLIQKLIHTTISTITSNKTLYNNTSIQLLVLGSGLDLSYDLYHVSDVYLVDFSEVIQQRKKQRCSSTLDPNITANLHYVSGDLRKFDLLWNDLLLNGLDVNLPTIIVCECVLCYIDQINMNKILSTLSLHLSTSILISYDPLIPHNTNNFDYPNMMYNKFKERNAPLLYNIQSKHQYITNLYTTGWKYIILSTINHAIRSFLSIDERSLIINTNEFDEYGSLALLHNLYVIVITCTDSLLLQQIYNHLVITTHNHKSTISSSSSLVVTAITTNSIGTKINHNQDPMVMISKLLIRISNADIRLKQLELISYNNNNNDINNNNIDKSYKLINIFLKSLHNPANIYKDIYIRTAKIKDIENLKILYESLFEDLSNKYYTVKKYIKYALKSMNSLYITYPIQNNSILMIVENNIFELIGCIGIKYHPNNEVCEISHFCIKKSQQSKGYGKYLLLTAISYCKLYLINIMKNNIKYIDLTVIKDLSTARYLYEFIGGFQLLKTEILKDGCEMLHMRKII